MSNSFELNIKKSADKFINNLIKQKGGYVKVGFVAGTFDTYLKKQPTGKKGKKKNGSSASSKTMTTLDTAIINEFGAPDRNIPARPFMQETLDQKRNELNALRKKYIKAILAGKMTQEYALELIGNKVASWMKNIIRDYKDPGNAASTIAKKGEDTPLRDTGTMMRSVTYQVVKNV